MALSCLTSPHRPGPPWGELTPTSASRKRSCRCRLECATVSMSVTVMSPPGPAASPIMAKFFSSSQPMAPAPTCEAQPLHPNAPAVSRHCPHPAHHKVLLAAQLLLEVSPEHGNLSIVAGSPLPGEGSLSVGVGTASRHPAAAATHRGAVLRHQPRSPLHGQALQGVKVKPLIQGQELPRDGLGREKCPCPALAPHHPAQGPALSTRCPQEGSRCPLVATERLETADRGQQSSPHGCSPSWPPGQPAHQ